MFAQTKELAVAVKNLINIISALGERDTEIPVCNVLFVRFNAVDCADIRRIFLGREQFLAVVCEELEVVNGVAVIVQNAIDNPLAKHAFG